MVTMTHRILVVEDDLAVRDVLRRYLEQSGHEVRVCADGAAGLSAAREWSPDLVVLDLMLPGLTGLQICEHLRSEGSQVPVIMLTALGETDDRIAGLSVGADDYVAKPFSVKELMLRIGSLLRRTAPLPAQDGPLVDGDLRLDPVARTATRAGQSLPLTAREFDLLAFFLRHPGQVFDRTALLAQVWHWDFGDHSTVTVHVKRLRHKVEAEPVEPRRLVTVYGQGYRWDAA